ncbi:FtsX-like permease family protein [Candidatus Microgenomates bacterium]|jgi:putative ABC transport system permease protein|nr:MAG: FtsX-like permease family protein [Candidatus Microgenomates bacterium]
MEYTEIITEAIGTLTVNKLRTGLATLGIVIGIGSVIALVSLGQASQKSVESQIQSLGSNLLTVSPGAVSQGGVRGATGGGTTLTLEDAKAISSTSQITTIQAVSPEYQSRGQVTTGRTNTNTQILGVTPVYADIRKVTMAQGSFISEQQVSGMAKVAVIGPTVVTDLFGEGASPVGQTVRINGQTLTIIGITEAKGGSGFQNQDDIVFVPLSTAQKQLFGADHLTSIVLEAKSADVMVNAQNEVGYFLLARHKLNDPAKADFSIMNQQDILNTVNQVTGTFTTLLTGVAAISLLVGGIGIMNIMLVTVTERTREIGLRKALGAKKKVIITQFLMESIILTFAGGLIGIGIGILASFIITKLSNSPFVVSPSSILLAFVVSAGIGILFGWYPAQKAANLQPIEALRYE